MSDLNLRTRGGIADDLAYLRAAYPKAQWRAHANFGELTSFWLHVHDGLRAEGARVAQTLDAFREGRLDAAQFQRAWVPPLNQFLGHLNAHHQIETRPISPSSARSIRAWRRGSNCWRPITA